MAKYLLRKNCEYSLMVEAPDLVKAFERGERVLSDSWDQVWSTTEAEKQPEEEVEKP